MKPNGVSGVRNRVFPGRFLYGGGYVIEELLRGKRVKFRAVAYGTDCYPRTSFEKTITLNDIPQAMLCNPRNSYQNYNVAVNKSQKTIYTYMGVLHPRMANANYCSAGQLSPLLNDPFYRVTGIGTRIFLCGAQGYIWAAGTQHKPGQKRTRNGVPMQPAGTMAVTGDLKEMSAKWLKGTSLTGYGVSMAVGIGTAIPIIDEEMAKHTGVSDKDIYATIVDYSEDYPHARKETLGVISYEELKRGEITIKGNKVLTGGISSYAKARDIANALKKEIEKGKFFVSEPVSLLPGARK